MTTETPWQLLVANRMPMLVELPSGGQVCGESLVESRWLVVCIIRLSNCSEGGTTHEAFILLVCCHPSSDGL